MKRVNSCIPSLYFVLALATITACGQGGGMDTGGGNLEEIREARISQQLARLKDDLKYVVSSLESDRIRDTSVRDTYQVLLDAGLLKDIEDSKYVVKEKCHSRVDGKTQLVAASAGISDRGGTICFNLPELVRMNASEREIFSLALHEHAHHLGYGEAAALAAGEALAGYVGASLYFHPRMPFDGDPSEPETVIASAPNSRCFDVSAFISRIRRMSPSTRGWSSSTDVRISSVQLEENEDDWFLAFAHQYWFSAPEEFSAPEAFDMRAFYQDGCKQLIVEEEDFFSSLEIQSYSPTHIRLKGSLTYNERGLWQVGSTYSAPDGIAGNRLVLETETVAKVVKSCESESDESQAPRQTRRVTGRIEMTFGEPLPESIPMSVRLAQLLDQGPEIENFLNGRGCTVDIDE